MRLGRYGNGRVWAPLLTILVMASTVAGALDSRMAIGDVACCRRSLRKRYRSNLGHLDVFTDDQALWSVQTEEEYSPPWKPSWTSALNVAVRAYEKDSFSPLATASLLSYPSAVLEDDEGLTWSTSLAVIEILSDIPLFVLGPASIIITGYMILIFGGLTDRGVLYLLLAPILDFIGGILDLSRILVLDARPTTVTMQSSSTGTTAINATTLYTSNMTSLSVGSTIFFAVAVFAKFLFLYRATCGDGLPRHVGWKLEPDEEEGSDDKEQPEANRARVASDNVVQRPRRALSRQMVGAGGQQDQNFGKEGMPTSALDSVRPDGEERERRGWATLGFLGSLAKFALVFGAANIAVLFTVQNIGNLVSVPSFTAVRKAERALEIVLYVSISAVLIWIYGIPRNVRGLLARVEVLPILAGNSIGLGVSIVGLAITTFDTTVVGRLLIAVQLFIYLFDAMISRSRLEINENALRNRGDPPLRNLLLPTPRASTFRITFRSGLSRSTPSFLFRRVSSDRRVPSRSPWQGALGGLELSTVQERNDRDNDGAQSTRAIRGPSPGRFSVGSAPGPSSLVQESRRWFNWMRSSKGFAEVDPELVAEDDSPSSSYKYALRPPESPIRSSLDSSERRAEALRRTQNALEGRSAVTSMLDLESGRRENESSPQFDMITSEPSAGPTAAAGGTSARRPRPPLAQDTREESEEYRLYTSVDDAQPDPARVSSDVEPEDDDVLSEAATVTLRPRRTSAAMVSGGGPPRQALTAHAAIMADSVRLVRVEEGQQPGSNGPSLKPSARTDSDGSSKRPSGILSRGVSSNMSGSSSQDVELSALSLSGFPQPPDALLRPPSSAREGLMSRSSGLSVPETPWVPSFPLSPSDAATQRNDASRYVRDVTSFIDPRFSSLTTSPPGSASASSNMSRQSASAGAGAGAGAGAAWRPEKAQLVRNLTNVTEASREEGSSEAASSARDSAQPQLQAQHQAQPTAGSSSERTGGESDGELLEGVIRRVKYSGQMRTPILTRQIAMAAAGAGTGGGGARPPRQGGDGQRERKPLPPVPAAGRHERSGSSTSTSEVRGEKARPPPLELRVSNLNERRGRGRRRGGSPERDGDDWIVKTRRVHVGQARDGRGEGEGA